MQMLPSIYLVIFYSFLFILKQIEVKIQQQNTSQCQPLKTIGLMLTLTLFIFPETLTRKGRKHQFQAGLLNTPYRVSGWILSVFRL